MQIGHGARIHASGFLPLGPVSVFVLSAIFVFVWNARLGVTGNAALFKRYTCFGPVSLRVVADGGNHFEKAAAAPHFTASMRASNSAGSTAALCSADKLVNNDS